MVEVAEDLYAQLVRSLAGNWEQQEGAFLQIFQARHGRILKSTPFAPSGEGVRRFAIRGEKVEGVLSFTARENPRRLVVFYEGTLAYLKEAVTRTSLLAMGPGFGAYEAVTVFAVDGWIHNQQRRYGISGGMVVDVDARKRSERQGFSELTKSILTLVDSYQYDRAIQLLNRNRKSIPDEELVRLYRDVAEQTHQDLTLPSHITEDIINSATSHLRSHQGNAVVVSPDGKII